MVINAAISHSNDTFSPFIPDYFTGRLHTQFYPSSVKSFVISLHVQCSQVHFQTWVWFAQGAHSIYIFWKAAGKVCCFMAEVVYGQQIKRNRKRVGLFISRLAGIEYYSLSSHCHFLTLCLPQMCLNRQCQNVSVFGVHECSAKCNGRGVSVAPLCASVIAVCLKRARSLVYIKQPCYTSVIYGVLHISWCIVCGPCWKAQSFSFPSEKTAPGLSGRHYTKISRKWSFCSIIKTVFSATQVACGNSNPATVNSSEIHTDNLIILDSMRKFAQSTGVSGF